MAFDEQNISAIANVSNKLQHINATVDTTTIASKNVTVSGNLNINDSALEINKINGLSSSLSNINSTVSTHTTQIDANTNGIITLNNNVNANQQTITDMGTTLSNMSTDVKNIVTINTSQSTSLSNAETNITALQNNVTDLQTNVTNVTDVLNAHVTDLNLLNLAISDIYQVLGENTTELDHKKATINTMQTEITAMTSVVPTNEKFSTWQSNVSILNSDVSELTSITESHTATLATNIDNITTLQQS